MLKEIKKQAMNQVFKLMSNPRVTELMSNPKVMNAISKGFEIHGQIRSRMEGGFRAIADTLHLATKEEVSSLKQKLDRVENHVGSLDQKLEASKKRAAPRKKPSKPKEEAPVD